MVAPCAAAHPAQAASPTAPCTARLLQLRRPAWQLTAGASRRHCRAQRQTAVGASSGGPKFCMRAHGLMPVQALILLPVCVPHATAALFSWGCSVRKCARTRFLHHQIAWESARASWLFSRRSRKAKLCDHASLQLRLARCNILAVEASAQPLPASGVEVTAPTPPEIPWPWSSVWRYTTWWEQPCIRRSCLAPQPAVHNFSAPDAVNGAAC